MTLSASYRWTDGSSYDYTRWAPGEPDGYYGYDDCVLVHGEEGFDEENHWDTVDCDEAHGWVCKIAKGKTFISRKG